MESNEFVIVLPCAGAQPAFSKAWGTFAYVCMLWWQIWQTWKPNNLQGRVSKLELLKKVYLGDISVIAAQLFNFEGTVYPLSSSNSS